MGMGGGRLVSGYKPHGLGNHRVRWPFSFRMVSVRPGVPPTPHCLLPPCPHFRSPCPLAVLFWKGTGLSWSGRWEGGGEGVSPPTAPRLPGRCPPPPLRPSPPTLLSLAPSPHRSPTAQAQQKARRIAEKSYRERIDEFNAKVATLSGAPPPASLGGTGGFLLRPVTSQGGGGWVGGWVQATPPPGPFGWVPA